MVRKTVAAVTSVLLGCLVLLGAPASAATCPDAPPEDVPFPATCIDGEWVGTDDGFGSFDEEFEESEREFKTFAAIAFVVVVGLGIGGVVWRVSAARGMARRAGMNEDDAANVALLGGHGIEAAYVMSNLQRGGGQQKAPAEEDTATRLAELQQLRDQGLITYDEYDAQRKKVIEDI